VRVAILPARGGSVRIPRKNIRPFRGKPMIEWPIEVAKASGLFDHVIVSTDDLEIKALALSLDCTVHLRPQDDGTMGTQEIAARVLQWLHAAPGDEACVIYPCSPMLAATDLCKLHEWWQPDWSPFFYIEGIAYWGRASAFIDRTTLLDSERVPLAARRFIDINTPEDWAQAEAMFDAQQP